MADIHGNPSPGKFSHPTGVGGGNVVKIGRFRSRGYGKSDVSGRVRKIGRYRSRGYGNGGGSVTKVGRYRNRAN